MRKTRFAVLGVIVAVGSLTTFASPAHACNEVGDPACTVGGAVNASACVASLVAESAKTGEPINKHELADCFNQTN
ncbi:MAG TPA: hypothetical protein VNP73_00130 [Actinomycetota bacterium]|nr:hypothetical protein [Actinomycetota bacterium]